MNHKGIFYTPNDRFELQFSKRYWRFWDKCAANGFVNQVYGWTWWTWQEMEKLEKSNHIARKEAINGRRN